MPAPQADHFVTGLVLGAGGSSRLGRPKQLLPYRRSTLLGHVVGHGTVHLQPDVAVRVHQARNDEPPGQQFRPGRGMQCPLARVGDSRLHHVTVREQDHADPPGRHETRL